MKSDKCVKFFFSSAVVKNQLLRLSSFSKFLEMWDMLQSFSVWSFSAHIIFCLSGNIMQPHQSTPVTLIAVAAAGNREYVM